MLRDNKGTKLLHPILTETIGAGASINAQLTPFKIGENRVILPNKHNPHKIEVRCNYLAKFAVPFVEFIFPDGGLKFVGDSSILSSNGVYLTRALFLDYINTFSYRRLENNLLRKFSPPPI